MKNMYSWFIPWETKGIVFVLIYLFNDNCIFESRDGTCTFVVCIYFEYTGRSNENLKVRHGRVIDNFKEHFNF